MTAFDWRAYRDEIDGAVPTVFDRDRMVALARDAADTDNRGRAVAALGLLRDSMAFGLVPPKPVRDLFVAGVDAYFADKHAEHDLDRHLGLSRLGRGSPNARQQRRNGERKFFAKVYRLVRATELSGAQAVALVHERDITRSPQLEKEPSPEALEKLWKGWRAYFDDEGADSSHGPDGDDLLDFLEGFREASRRAGGKTVERLARAIEERRARASVPESPGDFEE